MLDILPKIVSSYNNEKHGPNGMIPVQVTKKPKNINLILSTVELRWLNWKQIFKIKEYVRFSNKRGIFDKNYLSNWSTEIFEILTYTTYQSSYLFDKRWKQSRYSRLFLRATITKSWISRCLFGGDNSKEEGRQSIW